MIQKYLIINARWISRLWSTPPIISLKMSVSEKKTFEVAVLAEHGRLRKIEVFAQFFPEVVLVWYRVQYTVGSQMYIQMLKLPEKS